MLASHDFKNGRILAERAGTPTWARRSSRDSSRFGAQHDHTRINVESLSTRSYGERFIPVRVTADDEQLAFIEQVMNRDVADLFVVAVRTLVNHQEVTLLVEHLENHLELSFCVTTTRLLRIADDEANATDAKPIDDDRRPIEHVHAITTHTGHIIVIACHTDNPREDIRERTPHLCDIAGRATLIGSRIAVEVARKNDSSPSAGRQHAALGKIEQQLDQRDTKQLVTNDALQIAAAHDRIELVREWANASREDL